MFQNGGTLVNILSNLVLHLLLQFVSDSFTVLHAHLDDLERISE